MRECKFVRGQDTNLNVHFLIWSCSSTFQDFSCSNHCSPLCSLSFSFFLYTSSHPLSLRSTYFDLCVLISRRLSWFLCPVCFASLTVKSVEVRLPCWCGASYSSVRISPCALWGIFCALGKWNCYPYCSTLTRSARTCDPVKFSSYPVPRVWILFLSWVILNRVLRNFPRRIRQVILRVASLRGGDVGTVID